MNMTSMRPVRQLFKSLTSATKSFGTYGRTGLEHLGTPWGCQRGGPSFKAGCFLHFSFPRPFITSAACISRDFLTVKRSTLLHSKNCAFRSVILMDRNDSYKQFARRLLVTRPKPIPLNVRMDASESWGEPHLSLQPLLLQLQTDNPHKLRWHPFEFCICT